MNKLILRRYLDTKKMTFGEFEYKGKKLKIFSLERPNKNNANSVSCVPAGLYSLVQHSSSKHPNTFALVGETVSHYKSDKKRSTILIHPANFVNELEGCISCGKSITYIGNKIGVLKSRVATNYIINIINSNKISELVILDE